MGRPITALVYVRGMLLVRKKSGMPHSAEGQHCSCPADSGVRKGINSGGGGRVWI